MRRRRHRDCVSLKIRPFVVQRVLANSLYRTRHDSNIDARISRPHRVTYPLTVSESARRSVNHASPSSSHLFRRKTPLYVPRCVFHADSWKIFSFARQLRAHKVSATLVPIFQHRTSRARGPTPSPRI